MSTATVLGMKLGVAVWLVLVGAAEVVGVIALWRFFVRSEHGQVIDTIALTGNSIGQRRVGIITDTVLNTMSVISIAADRKSTRLNSSHVEISYAGFCLKKKRRWTAGSGGVSGSPR